MSSLRIGDYTYDGRVLECRACVEFVAEHGRTHKAQLFLRFSCSNPANGQRRRAMCLNVMGIIRCSWGRRWRCRRVFALLAQIALKSLDCIPVGFHVPVGERWIFLDPQLWCRSDFASLSALAFALDFVAPARLMLSGR